MTLLELLRDKPDPTEQRSARDLRQPLPLHRLQGIVNAGPSTPPSG